jgi:hypothetical protein
MLNVSIAIVAFIGTLGLLIGLLVQPTFLVCGSMLIGSALIAAAIASRNERQP